MTRTTAWLAAFAGAATFASVASGNIYISEVYAGMTGEDGTEDWFELTWTGAGTFDTGTLFYDDGSADPTVNASLTSFILNTGESAIFLIDSGAAEVSQFATVWGNVANVGVTTDGGGLGQSGDSVYLFDGNTAGANVVATVDTPGYNGNEVATFQYDVNGVASFSTLGDAGVFESNAFFNDNIGGPSEMITLLGSPGVVPAPGAVALLGLGGLVGSRRKR